MNLWDSLSGMVDAEITSASAERTLYEAARRGITVRSVCANGALTVRLRLYRRDLARLRALCTHRGDKLTVLKTRGAYWTLRRFSRRPVLLAGLALLLALTLLLPTRVLFVRVEGNKALPERLILEKAAEAGLCFGASRRGVRSEQLKNALLSALPTLKWVGVNTYGCTAVISVREGPQEESVQTENRVGSVVAACDGVIEACTVLAGSAACQPGDVVRAGEVLISGYTDCGITLKACWARGEVYARTHRALTVASPGKSLIPVRKTGTEHRVSLIIGKKRVNLWKGSGNWEGSCDKIRKSYTLTLPGGFSLPITLECEELTYREWEEAPEDTLLPELTAFSERYLNTLMVAGQILDSAYELSSDGTVLDAEFDCLEMIGREREQQMGDLNEYTD